MTLLRGVKVHLSPPDQTRSLAKINDSLEEALDDVDLEPLAFPGQAGMVREFLGQGVAEIPATAH